MAPDPVLTVLSQELYAWGGYDDGHGDGDGHGYDAGDGGTDDLVVEAPGEEDSSSGLGLRDHGEGGLGRGHGDGRGKGHGGPTGGGWGNAHSRSDPPGKVAPEPCPWETAHALALTLDLARIPAELTRRLARDPAARSVVLDLALVRSLRTLVAVLTR